MAAIIESNGRTRGGQESRGPHLASQPSLFSEDPVSVYVSTDAAPASHRHLAPEDSDDEESSISAENFQSVVGISIGHEQARLLSPLTPAAEKFAAIWGSMGAWGSNESEESDKDEGSGTTTLGHIPQDSLSVQASDGAWDRPNFSLRSPWTAKPKTFESEPEEPTEATHVHQREGMRSTSPIGMPPDLHVNRFLPHLNVMLADSVDDGLIDILPRNYPGNWRQHSPRWMNPAMLTPAGSQVDANQSSVGTTNKWETTEPSGFGEAPLLRRRTISDPYLALRFSAISAVSSLGDDTRWEHVQERVNGRIRAFKDSFQDSSLKISRTPNIKLSAFRRDFAHKRSRSEAKQAHAGGSAIHDNGLSPHGNPATTPAPYPKRFQKPPRSLPGHLDEALELLTGDVVIMGGYRGSILRSAEPPHRRLWAPVKVGLNMRKVNLEVGLEPEDEENMEAQIFPSGMLTHVGPIDIARRLFKRLRSCKNAQEGKLRVHDYGYDWRLSAHLLSRKLKVFLEGLPCNGPDVPSNQRGATVIAHSMGGLITRHVVNQRPDLFQGVVYAGVPQYCVSILGPFRNGDDVLLSSRVLTAQVNFTLRSSFVLLPESGKCFLDKDTKEEYPVDFFSVDTWKTHALSPCIAPALPALPPPERKRRLQSVSSSLLSINWPSSTASTSSPENTNTMPYPMGPGPTAKAYNVPGSEHMNMSSTSHPPRQSTLPLPAALSYLERTLAETLAFKRELAHNAAHTTANAYPPLAVLYATSIPTVQGVRVGGRDGIRRTDTYDRLAFASGDGVVLARAAMVPCGYLVAEGAKVKSERGHVGLLGDLEAVGRCLMAVGRARRMGVGVDGGLGGGQKGEAESRRHRWGRIYVAREAQEMEG